MRYFLSGARERVHEEAIARKRRASRIVRFICADMAQSMCVVSADMQAVLLRALHNLGAVRRQDKWMAGGGLTMGGARSVAWERCADKIRGWQAMA